jgi:hypothetical protein
MNRCDTVEFFFRKDTNDGSRRTKCERWGVVYHFEPGEQPPTPPAPPTPCTTTIIIPTASPNHC